MKKRKRRLSDEELLAAARGIAGKIDAICRKSERSKTKAMRREMLKRSSEIICYYCRRPLPASAATVEHKVPLSEGGKTTFSNCVWSCLDCNQARHRS